MKNVLQSWGQTLFLWMQGERYLGVVGQQEVLKRGVCVRLWQEPRLFVVTHLMAHSDGVVAVWVKPTKVSDYGLAWLEYASDYLSPAQRASTSLPRTYADLLHHLEQEELCWEHTAAWIVDTLNEDGSLREDASIRLPVFRKQGRSHLVLGWTGASNRGNDE